ncbi:putative manganese transporter [Pseudoalteromonas fenneropenaei]|uniref:Manganese transporter n=1 Tax=Pseudoalteromonas fenneropenaei TaxID=1737459 RepID=A0ABV7CHH5_9GAMM
MRTLLTHLSSNRLVLGTLLPRYANKRLVLPALLLVALASPSLSQLTVNTLSDAFFQVTVFVAATLYLYHFFAARLPELELSHLQARSPALGVFAAAILGALPGCGGAIIVVTQYTKGRASFATIVAVLTATMGDAAFLLLATKPLEGLAILLLSVVVGTLSGLAVQALKHDHYHQVKPETQAVKVVEDVDHTLLQKWSGYFWHWLMLPLSAISLLIAFNVDLSYFEPYLNYFGAAGAFMAVTLWAMSSLGNNYQQITSEEPVSSSRVQSIVQDTHFVTAWVVASFMCYELAVLGLGLDLKVWFSTHAVYAPLIALLIGMLPGCGPQIVVTSLYLQGIVPFSALAANAISNDGDALFPAIAMAPKAALQATIYSTIPAAIVGYGLYFGLAL